jgi:hypothetical protein
MLTKRPYKIETTDRQTDEKIFLYFRDYTNSFSFYKFVHYRTSNVRFVCFGTNWNHFNLTIKSKTLGKNTYNSFIAYHFEFRHNLSYVQY